MSKIAIVGCDSSGKTVFVSSLTDYFKSGQRPDQSCALRASDPRTMNYTNRLHHRMRVLGRWPERTADELEDTRCLKWDLVTSAGPLMEIEMLDFAGENFRRAFNGQKDNDAYRVAVGQLLDYIAQADFVVITVGLRNMTRQIRPELYESLARSEDEYLRDSEAQWVTTELLKSVSGKIQANPLSVVVALTQADRYPNELEEYGGAKGLFSKCWPEVAMLYPDLNVVPVASVDRVTEDGLPAKGYRTDGVLTVMKAFSRFYFGDCDDVRVRLDDYAKRLSDMEVVAQADDFSELIGQYARNVEEFKSQTVLLQEFCQDEVRKHMAFLDRCRQFEAAIRKVELRPLDLQPDTEYWAELVRLFPDFTKTVGGFKRFYQRKIEQAQREAVERAENARQAELARQEDARRAECERRAAEEKRLEDERRAEAERKAEMVRRQREAERLAAEQARQLEKKRIEAELERAKNERAEAERRFKARARVFCSVLGLLVLLTVGGAGIYWFSKEVEARKVESQRRQTEAALALAQEDAKAQERSIQLEVARMQAKTAEEKRRAETEAEERRAAALKEVERREAEKLAESQIESLRAAVSQDDLEEGRKTIAALRRGALTSQQEGIVSFCEQFCNRLERAANGDDASQVWIAMQHASQVTTITQDKALAKVWYEKAADSGNRTAMLQLAAWSEQGVGAARDLPRAAFWYEKAANAGDVNAMLKMALLSENGIGVTKDESQAIRWYERAASVNCGNAFYWLGIYNATGQMGVPKSYPRAHELFLKAKQNGCTYTGAESGVDAWIKLTESK